MKTHEISRSSIANRLTISPMQKLLIIVAIAGFGYFQLRKVLKRGGDVNSALELEVGARHSRIIGVTRQLSSFAD